MPLIAGAAPPRCSCPLFEEDGETRVILTKRPETMPSHQGEIAFPGGKFDPALDTDLQATALREAWEEVGLDRDDVDIVARLEGMATVASRFVITPFVGFLPGRPVLVTRPARGGGGARRALSELMADGVYREERWDTWKTDLDVHFYELTGETVWGATARILTGFLAHVVTGR